jgi:hypothetical protein
MARRPGLTLPPGRGYKEVTRNQDVAWTGVGLHEEAP